MLSGVVDHYLQGVSEREFDMPLMALLASRRFYDIHKIHGAFEFGKDFIAKRQDDGVLHQYAIQSKAGDINLPAWREIRHQVDEARYNRIAHPSYDQSLSRKAMAMAEHVDKAVANKARSLVGAIVSKQPGIRRPISDRWATSLMCATLAVFGDNPGDVEKLLKDVIVWVCDFYQNQRGLASPDSSEGEEIEYLLGASLEHIELRQRRSSYLATMAADLSAFFGFHQLYLAAMHDFNAVNLAPIMIIANERRAKWGASEFGLSSIPRVRYRDAWDSGTPLASHHDTVQPEGVPAWDAVALSCLPRNRHPFWAFHDLCPWRNS